MRSHRTPTLRHTGRLPSPSTENAGYPLNIMQHNRGSPVNGLEQVRRHGSSRNLLSPSSPPSVYDESDVADRGAYSDRAVFDSEDAHLQALQPDYFGPYTPPHRPVERDRLGSDTPSPLRRSNDDPQTEHLVQTSTAAGDSDTTLVAVEYQQSTWLPWLAVIVPPLIVPVVLMALISAYRVPYQRDLLSPSRPPLLYVLVDLEDTKIMFVVSALATICPLIGEYLMGLHAPRVVHRFRGDIAKGPPPTLFEFALLGGICQASIWEFAKASYYRLRGKANTTKSLQLAFRTYSKLILLWLATYGAIGLLHLTTRMVEYDKLDFGVQSRPGRGLTERCLAYDRTQNDSTQRGLPCSDDYSNPNRAYQLREEFRLQRDTSKTTGIDVFETDTDHQNLGLLLPRDVPPEVDYRASTLGLCTECSFITDQCGMHDGSTDPYADASFWTIFNCSSGLYGALGKDPVVVSLYTNTDGDIPYLGFKPAYRLQMGYFFDPGLEFPYNPVGYDHDLNRTLPPYTDVELINPVFLGVVARIGYVGLGEHFPGNQDVWSGQNRYIDFAMRCKISTFEVAYTSINGSLSNVSLTDTNGTIFEIFHGNQFYDTFSSGGSDYLEMLSQAGLQNSTTFLARKWETLFTAKALSTIGSVSEPRVALMQQARQRMLVARIQWPALALLFFFPVCYVVAGISVIRSTRDLSLGEKLLSEVLSTPGAGFIATAKPAYMQQALKSSAAPQTGDEQRQEQPEPPLTEVQGQVTIVESGDFFQISILDGQGTNPRI